MAGIKHIDVGTQLTKVEWEAVDTHELTSGTSFPEAPSEKDLFYRTDTHKWYQHDGSDWVCINKPNLNDLGNVDAAAPSTGDALLYNEVTSKWESNSQPWSVSQINLTPQASPPSDAEGGIYYNSDDDHLYVGTEV